MEERPRGHASESGYLDGKRYNVAKLYAFAENIPEENISLEEFRSIISPDNTESIWMGNEGEIIGPPYNVMKDWDAAQQNPLWDGHVRSVRNADLNFPILVSFSGHVVDGQHRIVRAFIDGASEIKAKRLPRELPESLEM